MTTDDNTVRDTFNQIQEKLDTLTQLFELQKKMIVNREETIKILKEANQRQFEMIKVLRGAQSDST